MGNLVTNPETTSKTASEAARNRPYDRLKAYVVSDVHLNNHPYDTQHEVENPRRRNFRLFLTQINESLKPNDRLVLVLNGDILDITGSWFEDVMPWDADTTEVEQLLHRLLIRIMENNLSTFAELRRLIEHPMAEIVYVYGNHDGLLQEFPSSHDIIRGFLSPHPEAQTRVRFSDHYASDELDLYIEHGHRLDPFNRVNRGELQKQPPLGDVINILVVNRFVELALERLRANGYSEDFIRAMHNRLHDIEYLRPLALVPVWIQTLANEYSRHPESRGKSTPVREILISVVSDIMNDPQMMQFMTRQLPIPRTFLHLLFRTTLKIPAILPLVSFVTSILVRRGHSNKYQYRAAQRIHQEKGYRMIAFGHTHLPGVLPLSQNAYFFNTGSWKPVINLFKFSKDPVELEYLSPDVQFNKVERCGILRIEKSDFSGRTPAEFALQTIQSGLS